MSQPAVKVRRPTQEDIEILAANLRDQDLAECQAAGHTDMLKVIANGVAMSTMCWAAFVDGRLACIFGVAPHGSMLSERGIPWLLGTSEIKKHRRVFVRLSRPYIDEMLRAYPYLFNAVHARNTVAMRWLKHMGFKLYAAVQVEGGEMFHPFELRA
jgi:hypothetical protein